MTGFSAFCMTGRKLQLVAELLEALGTLVAGLWGGCRSDGSCLRRRGTDSQDCADDCEDQLGGVIATHGLQPIRDLLPIFVFCLLVFFLDALGCLGHSRRAIAVDDAIT